MKSGDEKKFISIANSVGELVQEKNKAYGDSFAKSQEIVRILFPDGVQPGQYRDMLAITRVIDKLFRIATKKDAFGESPWRDICGYAILGIANDEAGEEDIIDDDEAREERLTAAILQSVRERREEGHGNPYANIDRDVRLSYAVDEEETNAEGHKENKDNELVSFDEWNSYVSSESKSNNRSSKDIKGVSEKSHE